MFDVLASEVEINQPLFIEASAGTGKTFAIEHLFIRRLLEPLNGRFLGIEEIACLTFTRACSEELKQRIRAIINNTVSALQSQGELPVYLQRVVDRYSASSCLERLLLAKTGLDIACISTIHGFAARLLHEFYQGHEAADASFIEQEALHALVYDILSFETDALLSVLVQSLLAHKQPLSSVIKIIVDSLWDSSCVRDVQEIIDTLQGKIKALELSKDDVRDMLYAESEGYCGIKNKEGLIKAEVVRAFEAFIGLFSAENAQTAWLPLLRSPFVPSELFSTLKKDREASRFVEEKLMPLDPELMLLGSSDMRVGFIASRLLPHVRKQLMKRKLYTPQSLLLDTVDSLANPAFKAFVEAKIGAIFIDEFQDTDPLQWKLFSSLFNPERQRCMYLVGDPKQSMYRFRGADIYTYLDVKRSFPTHNILTLDSNYRSAPALTESLNSLFAEAQTSSLFEMPHTQSFLEVVPLQAKGKAEQVVDGKGALCIPVVREQLGKKRSWPHEEAETKMLAYIADEIIRSQLPLSSFAVLVKDRNQSSRVQQFLKERHLPVEVRERKPLGQTEALHALVRFLRAFEAPEKRTIGLELLACAPWNIPPDELKRCAHDVTAYTEQAKFLFDLHELYHRKGLLATLQQYSQSLQKVASKEFYKDFIHCIDLIGEECNTASTQAVQDALSLCTRLYAYPEDIGGSRLCRNADSTDSVTVLTMHKSKGLEFDVVFALGVASRGFIGTRDVEEQAEKMRIFYVAATRAKRRLYLPFFLEEEKGIPDESRCSPFELVMVRQGIKKHDGIYALATQIGATIEEVGPLSLRVYERPIVSKVQREELSENSCTSTSGLNKQRLQLLSFSSVHRESVRPGVTTEVDFPRGPLVGILLHRLIYLIGTQRLPCSKESVDAFVQGTPLAAYAETVLQRMQHVFSVPCIEGQALFQIAQDKVWFETPFFLYENECTARHGAIDLIVEDETGYYVIDFKTHIMDSYTTEALRKYVVDNGYMEQARLYSQATQRLFSHRKIPFKGFMFVFIHGVKEAPGVYSIPTGELL